MSVAACPGCVTAGPTAERLAHDIALPTHELILPSIHCLACIKAVEQALHSVPDIESARVNLSRKRVSILARNPAADPTPWIEHLSALGYEAHEARQTQGNTKMQGLVLRLGISGFAMMNVMLLSVAVWSGATDATRDLFHWISAAIALPATLFCAEPFFSNAWSAIKARRLNMDVPIALAIFLACMVSVYETMHSGAHAYFDAALSLTFFLLAGRTLDAWMRSNARSAAADLAALEPRRVITLVEGQQQSRAIDDIAVGTEIHLTAGMRVPLDALLLSERTEIDRSALTGESETSIVLQGAHLTAGEIVVCGPISARTTVPSSQSTLRRMVELASIAEAARGRYSSLADRAAQLYAPVIHGLSLVGGMVWFFLTGDVHKAVMVAIATLIITCPCALGLAVPAVATVATNRIFRLGALVKSDTALERLATVTTIAFDKTGTLTQSALIVPANFSIEECQVLKALAMASQHPLSQSLLPALADVTAAAVSGLKEYRGQGIWGRWNGQDVRLGSGAWVGAEASTVFQFGKTIHPLSRTEHLIPGAKDTIRQLQDQGYDVHLVSGDKQASAAAMARDLNIAKVHAEMTPEAKQTFVADIQAKGEHLLMVGDGLNDTLALTQAWASIAPGSALEASQNAADIVLLDGDLAKIPETLRLAKSARRRILENFALAASYNAVAIPIALSGFASPLFAALAMSLSSITVTLNALRVR